MMLILIFIYLSILQYLLPNSDVNANANANARYSVSHTRSGVYTLHASSISHLSAISHHAACTIQHTACYLCPCPLSSVWLSYITYDITCKYILHIPYHLQYLILLSLSLYFFFFNL